MSIDSEQQAKGTITKGDRALDLFTDRYSFTRLLAEWINDDTPDKRILFFHGAGGNGKSLLLKYLQQTICKRLTSEGWARVKDSPDDELQAAIKNWPATDCFPVPSALLDFSSRSGQQNTDLFYGLLRIRQMLAASLKAARQRGMQYSIKFPLHTYGCFLYLQKTNRLKEVDDLFRFEEVGLVRDFVGLMQEVPTGVGFGLSVLKLINKYSGDRITHYKRRFGLSEQRVKELQAMDAERELRPLLPVLLGQDLQAAFAERSQETPERVVLFFDTHEAFYGADRNRQTNFFRDVWLRRLLRELLEMPEVVVIVSGRDVPRWAEADEYELETEIAEACVCRVPVDSLAVGDADSFLQKASIVDEAMRQSLIHYASEGSAVHPLHLGLCVDVVTAAAREGQPLTPGDFSTVPAFKKKNSYLIRQLLSYVDDELEYAIRALGACRSFDFSLYRLLGNALEFAVSRPVFNRLVSFSFVREIEIEAEEGERQYRIHDLLRRLDDAPVIMQAHEVLAEHFQQQSSLEFIYHINQLDWVQGVDLWVEVFKQALEVSRYDICGTLLDLRRELIIRSPFKLGLVSDVEGQYFQNLAQYTAALKEYQEAIKSFKEGLANDPFSMRSLKSKGNSLGRLAELYSLLSQNQQAQEAFDDALKSYDSVLIQTSEDVSCLNNKGIALKNLAIFKISLSQHEQAQKVFNDSLAVFNEALKRKPDSKSTISNKGVVFLELANLQAKLSQYEGGKKSCADAIESFDAILKSSPNSVIALNNKGLAFQKLADLQAELSQIEKAQESYTESIKVFETVLEKTPSFLKALGNKGLAWQGLADLQSKLSQYKEALQSYANSVESLNILLESAPSDVHALSNKGTTLRQIADLQIKLGLHTEAEQNYILSLETLGKAIEKAPKFVGALSNKANSLSGLADLQVNATKYTQAEKNYADSIDAYNTALKLAPDDVYVLNNKGITFQKLADLQALLEQHQSARQNYMKSVESIDIAITLAPDYVLAINSKGFSLMKLALLEDSLDNIQQAQQRYAESVDYFDMVLFKAPKYVLSLANKGSSLQQLASLLIKRGEPEKAIVYFTEALIAWRRALEISPDDTALSESLNKLIFSLQDWLDSIQKSIAEQERILEKLTDDKEYLLNHCRTLLISATLQNLLFHKEKAVKQYGLAFVACKAAMEIAPEDTSIRPIYDRIAQFLEQSN